MGRDAGNCQRARVAVSLDVDDALSELERAFLHAHVARCAACAAYCVDVAAMTLLLRAQPFEPLAHGVNLAHAQRTWRRGGLRVATSGAAALLLMGVMAAAQFAHSTATFSRLGADATNAAGSTVELKQIYEEVELAGRHDTPSFVPTSRVR